MLQIKLLPDDEQAKILIETMKRFNAACNYISEVAFEQKQFNKYGIHHLVYFPTKERFELSAQLVIRAIAKVTDAYKADKKVCRKFKTAGAVPYDNRIYSFRGIDKISISTVNGRQVIPIIFGQYQKAQMHRKMGQAHLVYRGRKFYLLISVETETEPPIDPKSHIGIDLGIIDIASDSTGESFSGKAIDTCRDRYQRVRSSLQQCGTASAKRHLQKIRSKEANFRRYTNHCISKRIVEKAKRSRCGIVLEDLRGIRKRTKARKSNRSRMQGWSFFQLRSFIEYKSALAGVPVEIINPAYTSQRCSQCGHTSRKNRKSQSKFTCVSCSYVDNADHNASVNISLLGWCKRTHDVGAETAKGFANCAIA